MDDECFRGNLGCNVKIATPGASLRENKEECLLFRWMMNVFVAISVVMWRLQHQVRHCEKTKKNVYCLDR
jgi:hypothetical protein